MYFIFILCRSHDQLHRNPPSCVVLVATEPSAGQPWLCTVSTAAVSLRHQIQGSRLQSTSNMTSEYQSRSKSKQWLPLLENIHNTPGRKASRPPIYLTLIFRDHVEVNLKWNTVWLLDKTHLLVFNFLYRRLENIKTHISRHVLIRVRGPSHFDTWLTFI